MYTGPSETGVKGYTPVLQTRAEPRRNRGGTKTAPRRYRDVHDCPFSSATPPTFTGTRPTCHFFPSSQSSLDTYRIIAASRPFYNSPRIRGNAPGILIFPGKFRRTETEWLRGNPLQTFPTALWLFLARIFSLALVRRIFPTNTFNRSAAANIRVPIGKGKNEGRSWDLYRVAL